MQLSKILAKSNLGKKLSGETLQHAPTLYKKGVPKKNNLKVGRVLDSYLPNTAANYRLEFAKNTFHKY